MQDNGANCVFFQNEVCIFNTAKKKEGGFKFCNLKSAIRNRTTPIPHQKNATNQPRPSF